MARRPLAEPVRLALAALLLVLAATPAAAQRAPDAPVILVFHAWPDALAGEPGADPFSSPDATPLPGLDAARLPATRADGVLDADPAPEGSPESAVAHVRELQRLLALRDATPPGATLEVDGAQRPGMLRVNVTATAREALGRVEARVVLVEDEAPYDGRAHRLVARLVAAPENGTLAPGESLRFARDLPIPANVDASRVGVAVSLRALDAAGLREAGEVVQAAWWAPRQEGPTRQEAKAVLVEHVTATWCEPCAASDSAIDLLASRDADASSATAYARAPTPWAAAGLAGGVALAAVAWRRLRA